MSESQELHTILVWLQGQQGVTQYVFRSAERALAAFKRANDKTVECHELRVESDVVVVEIIDDFGRALFTPASNVLAIQLVDVAAELNGQAELAILQAHANLKLQKRAQQDPMLSGRPIIVGAPGPGMNGPLPFPPGGRN